LRHPTVVAVFWLAIGIRDHCAHTRACGGLIARAIVDLLGCRRLHNGKP
jgi:hypothetical protein